MRGAVKKLEKARERIIADVNRDGCVSQLQWTSRFKDRDDVMMMIRWSMQLFSPRGFLIWCFLIKLAALFRERCSRLLSV